LFDIVIFGGELLLLIDRNITGTKVLIELFEEVWTWFAQHVKPAVRIVVEGVEDIIRDVLRVEIKAMPSVGSD
jgi:hypothetical protein